MRAILFLAGAAMAASFFLTWIEPPFHGTNLSPWVALDQGVMTLSADTSWITWVFVGGFACAGLCALLVLAGRPPLLLAVLAGLSPLVVAGALFFEAQDLNQSLGLPFEVDFSDLGEAWNLLSDFVRVGLWAYLGGALLLLLVGLSRATREVDR
jgi:hypothetical protein